MSGTVELINDKGEAVADRGDILVTLEPLDASTLTSRDGTWSFEEIPEGSYDILFGKDGYAPVSIFDYLHVPIKHDTIIQNTRLFMLPSLRASDLFLKQEGRILGLELSYPVQVRYTFQLYLSRIASDSQSAYVMKVEYIARDERIIHMDVNLDDTPFLSAQRIKIELRCRNSWDPGSFDPVGDKWTQSFVPAWEDSFYTLE